MSAEILTFPVPAATRLRAAAGDIVVACLNAAVGLWCAWPVADVDDDGVVTAVFTRDGRRIGADRVNCQPTVYGLRAADHQPLAFAGMRWRTWPEAGAAMLDFAAIGVGVEAEDGQSGNIADGAGPAP